MQHFACQRTPDGTQPSLNIRIVPMQFWRCALHCLMAVCSIMNYVLKVSPLKLARFISCLTLCFLLTGCDQDLVIDQEYSVNIIKPGPKFPNEKKLTEPQKEIYARMGKPDCFHVYWTSNGALANRRDLTKQFKDDKP